MAAIQSLYVTAQPVVATRVGVNDADYTAASGETYIGMVALSANRTITLAAARTGQRLTIKDESGACSSTKTITVNGTIDGQTSRVIATAYGGLSMYYNGNAWSEV